MTDQAEVARVVADCERYWRETGVPRRAIAEMRLELEQHLQAATSEGRTIEAVTGRDVAGFAESWAAEYRSGDGDRPAWDQVTGARAAEARANRRANLGYIAGAISLMIGVAAGSLVSGGGESVDNNELWRWVWTILAVAMGIGEIFTAGFFLLPFAIGAAAAAVLAWTGITGLLAQWFVFFGVSIISLVYLRRFIAHQDAMEQPRIGANRWIGASGIVLQDVDNRASTGMVRIDSEEWRATSETGEEIPVGTRIVVREVRGSRLVVAPHEDI